MRYRVGWRINGRVTLCYTMWQDVPFDQRDIDSFFEGHSEIDKIWVETYCLNGDPNLESEHVV